MKTLATTIINAKESYLHISLLLVDVTEEVCTNSRDIVQKFANGL